MKIPTDALINDELVNHTKFTIGNKEKVLYYVDKKVGIESIDRYERTNNGSTIYVDTIKTVNVGHTRSDHDFIINTFGNLDKIIDLDFEEMSHNNGSMIDIYHISYSSHFKDNVIGQALTQKTEIGGWWDIFWKDSKLLGEINSQSNQNTIIHEIGHSLGLSHPFNNPGSTEYSSEDTIMSYHRGSKGWDNWFSKNDINALIKIWGREDDLGYINYEGNSKNYKFKSESNEKYFIETEIGYEDISGLETLIFNDKNMNVRNDVIGVFEQIEGVDHMSGKIYRLYNAAFNRFPDSKGLNYWIENNSKGVDTYKSTAISFVNSEEFSNTYGSDPTDSEFILNLYRNVLSRTPDQEGYSYWLNQLSNGIETQSEILMGFSESYENKTIFSAETGFHN